MSDLTPEAVKAALDAATPGPWEIDEETDVLAPDGDMEPWHVAIATECCGHPIDQSPANARLIAMAPTLAAAYLELAEENQRLRKPEHAAASILASGMGWIAPVVLNAVDAERAKWEANPMVKRGEVPPETITLAMFEACLRALAAYQATEDGK